MCGVYVHKFCSADFLLCRDNMECCATRIIVEAVSWNMERAVKEQLLAAIGRRRTDSTCISAQWKGKTLLGV